MPNTKLPNAYPMNDAPILEGDIYINLLTWSIEIASKNVELNWAANMSYNDGKRFLRDDIKKVTLNNQIITYPDALLRVKNVLQSGENKKDILKNEGYSAFHLSPGIAIAFKMPQEKILVDLTK